MTYCTNCHMGVAKYPGGLCFYCHGLPAGILARDYPQYYPLRTLSAEAEPIRRTCTLCKQPVVDGRCRCIIG